MHRRDHFRAERILQERLFKHPKIKVVWDAVDRRDPRLGEPEQGHPWRGWKNVKTGALTDLKTDGVFIAIGHAPATELVKGQIKLKPSGYVEVAPNSTATSVPGLFAAGDVADETYRQAVDRRRPRLHGCARGGTLPGSSRERSRSGGIIMARSRDGFTDMDWDKLKVFHAAAEAGSFTHAGEQLGLSQSAVSRQVSALEQELSVSLFHRHARGLILTEQGDLLFRTAHDVFMQLQAARAKLTDSRERPSGDLKITTPPALGINWLIPRLDEFTALYPDIRISLIVTDEDLDLSMREADVAIRTRKPTQPDLIQRKLFSIGFHAYCSPEYIKRFGTPRTLDDLDSHPHHHARRLAGAAASAEPQLADRRRPQRLRPARALLQGQQHPGPGARLPAGPRHRRAAGLSGRTEQPRAAVRRVQTRSRSTPTSSIRKS